MEHTCDQMPFVKNTPNGLIDLGVAEATIEKIDGVWMAHNGKYYAPINFCPFCGVELKTLDKTEKK